METNLLWCRFLPSYSVPIKARVQCINGVMPVYGRPWYYPVWMPILMWLNLSFNLSAKSCLFAALLESLLGPVTPKQWPSAWMNAMQLLSPPGKEVSMANPVKVILVSVQKGAEREAYDTLLLSDIFTFCVFCNNSTNETVGRKLDQSPNSCDWIDLLFIVVYSRLCPWVLLYFHSHCFFSSCWRRRLRRRYMRRWCHLCWWTLWLHLCLSRWNKWRQMSM